MVSKPPPGLNAPPRRPSPGDEALQRAAFAIQSQRPAEAERIAGELLKRNAGDLRAMQIMGYALLMQNRGPEAIAPLERVAKQTHDPTVETQLALALKQADRKDEALARLERATKRQPPFPPAWLELGSLLSALGRPDEAIEALKRGLELAPNFADLWVQLGTIYSDRGDSTNAREALTRAVAAAPTNTDAIFMLARILQNQCDHAQAVEVYRRMLAVAPNDAAARIGLGVCLLELGQADAGLESLRTASRASAKMFGEALTALVSCGRGRFWLKPSDAEQILRGKKL